VSISKRLRYEIFRRDRHTCRYCGATPPSVAITIDHVTPRVLGGTDDPSNLVTACTDCNSGKGSSSVGDPPVADLGADRRLAAAVAEVLARHRADAERFHGIADRIMVRWEQYNLSPADKQRAADLHFEYDFPPYPDDAYRVVRGWLAAGLDERLIDHVMSMLRPWTALDTASDNSDRLWPEFVERVNWQLQLLQAEARQHLLQSDVQPGGAR
jgi:hypothetical protein